MPAKALNERVSSLAADVLEVPAGRLTPASSPETVGTWDSVHHLNLVLALEQEFNLQFEPEEIDQMKDLSQILKMVAAKTGQS